MSRPSFPSEKSVEVAVTLRAYRDQAGIFGPYAKPGFVDHNVAGFTSMLTYVEETFGLAPLSIRDADAYDYAQSFDYTQPPLAPVPMTAPRAGSRFVICAIQASEKPPGRSVAQVVA